MFNSGDGGSWGQNLVFGTSVAALSGVALGYTIGFFEGIKYSKGLHPRVRLSWILNSCKHRGRSLGIGAGLVVFNFFTWQTALTFSGVPDTYTYPLAGAITGAVWRIGKGRGMAHFSILG